MRLAWRTMTGWIAFLAVSGVLLSQTPRGYFVISVVDEATGRGVPLVELKTVAGVSYYTDSNGLVAFYEPGLMGRRVFFFIKADGYACPEDSLGYRGQAFEVKAGSSAVVKLKRTEIAERLYRLTGEGIYRDTVMAGRKPPIGQPLVNGGVAGIDGPQTTVYSGKVYWFFGDTSAVSYPLGNFASTGATSELPQRGGLNPSAGVNLHYFLRPDGFVKPMLDIPGEGPKWMAGLMVLRDRSGRERLLTQYRRVQQDMATKEIGLAVLDDDAQAFHKLVEFPLNAKTIPDGRPFLVRSGGEDYYQFGLLTLPWVRVKADWDAVQHLENYEAYTCYKPGAGAEPERDADGKLVCRWKRNADPMGWNEQKSLVASRKLTAQEGMWQVRDVDSGQQVEVRSGTTFWNEYRKRWIAIFERPGSSIYFAEADTPVGPWVYARKVADFEHYTFYWPGQLPYFDEKGGRTIYFAGTYSDAFSSAPVPTPRYNYNVIMYRLSLDDPRLALPAPIYRITGSRYLMREAMEVEGAWGKQESIPFLAVPPHAVHAGLIPIFAVQSDNGTTLSANASPGSAALFYALPPITAPSQIPEGPSGNWSCTAHYRDGSDFIDFPLDLSLMGDTVRVMSGDGGGGSFTGGELRLHVKAEDGSYDLNGALDHNELSGSWSWRGQRRDNERGSWSCKRRLEAQPAASPEVVPLFEYTSTTGDWHVYSTDPDLHQAGLNRSATPICRVWRTPMSQMILDPDENPVIAREAPK